MELLLIGHAVATWFMTGVIAFVQVVHYPLMAQVGSFVPADEARIGVVDRIFSRVGAQDHLLKGQSTFMVEMNEAANILNNATARSLIILDEIGRGTSTFDGISIAWSIVEYLHALNGELGGPKTLFATHYHELTDLALVLPGVKNFNVQVKEWNDEIIFLRKLVKGGTNRSYGIQVARLAGIPNEVIDHAKKKLLDIENRTPEGMFRQVSSVDGGRMSKHTQLGLFRTPTEEVLDKLRRIDINRTSPMEALNWLDLLKKAVTDLNGE